MTRLTFGWFCRVPPAPTVAVPHHERHACPPRDRRPRARGPADSGAARPAHRVRGRPRPGRRRAARGRPRQRHERGAAGDAARQRRDRRLDQDGRLFYRDVRPTARTASPSAAPAGAFPYDQTFLLHSRPGAQRTIYLDFNGQDVSGTAWNGSDGSAPGSIPACRTTPTPLHGRGEGHRPGRLAAGRRGLRAVRGRRDHRGPRHRGAHPDQGHGPGLRDARPGHRRELVRPRLPRHRLRRRLQPGRRCCLPARLGVLRRGRQRPDPDRRVDQPRGRPHARAVP